LTDFRGLLDSLCTEKVEFIIIGGIAGAVHGAARATYDLDIVYSRARDNIAKLVNALAPLNPYLRGAPPDLPFRFDAVTVERGMNFTLTTKLGDLDIFGDITGGGEYEALLPHTIEVQLFGRSCRCLDIDKLIQVKRAAGRPRDLEAIAELETIRERKRRNSPTG
jgi:hypothetical protein